MNLSQNPDRAKPISSLLPEGEHAVNTHPLDLEYAEFMRQLDENAENLQEPEVYERYMENLERYAQNPDRQIELFTDPTLETFMCARVPAKKLGTNGEIEDDPNNYCYMIGLPAKFVLGRAPMDFMLGEVFHEEGHAIATDFDRIEKRFPVLSAREGIDPKILNNFNNCLEDPRMERSTGGPRSPGRQHALAVKNRRMIIPNIAQGLRQGSMSRVEQFNFLIKVEGLWRLYDKQLDGLDKPWNLDNVHPDVRAAYESIREIYHQIVGDSTHPAMKSNPEVEKLIVEHFLPILKQLSEQDKAQPLQQKKGQDGDPNQPGEPGESGDAEGDHLNPNDPDSWPDDMKRILQKLLRKREEKWQKKSEAEKQRLENQKNEGERIEQIKHNLLKKQDGFEELQDREKYRQRAREMRSVTVKINRVLRTYLPKLLLEIENSHRGRRFDVRSFIKRIGTGREKPMLRNTTPEEVRFALQVLVDVSGSMYNPKNRIENTVNTLIALIEAIDDLPMDLEILANDDKNLTDDEAYIIKAFNEALDGKLKARVISMIESFGGDNEDAAAIEAARPRMRAQKRTMASEADRIGTLTLYITDSTTAEIATCKAANATRAAGLPLEGTAITPEKEIVENVKFHFGPDSLVPNTPDEFTGTFRTILERHVRHLKSKR